MRFAVIGTREPTQTQLDWVRESLNLVMGRDDISTLCTGAALGVDQFAAETWAEMGGKVSLYLPWPSYENDWREMMGHKRQAEKWVSTLSVATVDHAAYEPIAAAHHAKWAGLSQGVRKLHSRNVGIVHGCNKVFAAPGSSVWGGGTAMGIRIARHFSIETEICDGRTRDASFWEHCGCPKGYKGGSNV